MMSSDYAELLERIEGLSRALSAKEQENASLMVRNAALERELRINLSAKEQDVVILQQRLAKANEEVASMGEGLRRACGEVASLENTLTHVQRELATTQQQLSSTQHELSEKTTQLQELHTYYASVLEAKESSLTSLQGLLTSQQATMQEQQQLWDEQRTALQDSLDVLRDSADTNAAAAATAAAQSVADSNAAAAAAAAMARSMASADAGAAARRAVEEAGRGQASRWGVDTRQQADLVLFLEGKVEKLEREKRGLVSEKSDLMQEKHDLALEVKELVRERGQLHRRLQGQEARLESGQDEVWEAKLEELETKMAKEKSEVERRVRVLEAHLKDREKLLVKADKRYQELTRKYLALGNALESAVAAPPGVHHAPGSHAALAAGLHALPRSQALELQSLLADAAAAGHLKNGAAPVSGFPTPCALRHTGAFGGLDVVGFARDAQLSADALQHARAQLLEANGAREALQQQLQLIQEAFEEECQKGDQAHAKLSSKLKAKTLLLAERDAELANKKVELAAARALMEAAQKTADAGQKQVDAAHQSAREGGEAARQRERGLQAEIDGLRAEVVNMRAELVAAGTALRVAQTDAARAQGAVAAEHASAQDAASRHAARVKELEAQLHHLTIEGGPRSIAAEAELRHQRGLCARMEADLAARSSTVQQLQHSLHVLRAHWGSFRQLLTRLHVVVQEAEAGRKWEESARHGGSSGPKGGMEARADGGAAERQKLDQLLMEWDPSSKEAFDAAAEASLGAASTLLDEATDLFQAMSRSSSLAKAASATHASQVAALEEQKDMALRKAQELQLQLTKERLEAKAAEQGVQAAEASTAQAKQQVAAAQVEVSELREALHAERRATRDALAEVSAASAQMAQLQAKLRDKMGQADGDLRLKQEEAVHAQRTIADLQTNVAALHVRLEHSQANIAQVDNLKARIAHIMAQVTVPRILPSQPPPTQPQSQPADPLAAAALPLTFSAAAPPPPFASAGAGGSSGPGACALSTLSVLQLDAELAQALDRAVGQTQSVVAACALLEACHWELERGLAGVALAQGHMAGLKQELAAGRMSTALVMAQELQALMDLPTSNPQPHASDATLSLTLGSRTAGSPHKMGMGPSPAGALVLQAPSSVHHPLAAAYPPKNYPNAMVLAKGGSAAATHSQGSGRPCTGGVESIHVGKLQSDMEGARHAAMHAAACSKTAEGLLLGLRQALPEWMEVTRAQCHSQYSEELSRLRVLAGSAMMEQQQQQQPPPRPAATEDGMASIRQRMSMLQQEHDGLASECASLQSQLLTLTSRGGELLVALQRMLPLPPELVQGLKDGFALHLCADGSSVADRAGGGGSSSSSGGGSSSGRPGSEGDERGRQGLGVGGRKGGVALGREADGVFSRAVLAMQQLAASFLQQLEVSGQAQGQYTAQIRAQQEVEPLKETCRLQQQQLAALQAQLQGLLHHAHQALNAAQAESAAAASGALHDALEGMRDEADEVQAALQQLSKASASTWDATLQGWQQSWQGQHASAKQAIHALQTAAAHMQDRLHAEAQDHQSTRQQGQADTSNLLDQAESQSQALSRAEAELQSVRQQLAASQKAQEALVKETIARHRPISGRSPLSTVVEDASSS